MDISPFFDPIDPSLSLPDFCPDPDMWGRSMKVYDSGFPEWQSAELIILGAKGPDEQERSREIDPFWAIRAQLYRLSVPDDSVRVVDLGNLNPKDTQEAFHERLAYVLGVILKEKKTVMIIGGRQDLCYGQYLAYEETGTQVEYVHIDARFDIEDSSWEVNDRSVNHKIFLHQPDYLFNYTNLGYQRYFVSEQQLEVLKNLNYAAIRYGALTDQIEEVEPYLRMADMVSIDVSAIRSSEAPGVRHPSPGGFSAEQACRIARYAGLGYQVSTFSLTELELSHDQRSQSALLSAMMLWYFVHGYAQRKSDQPLPNYKNLRKYTVQLHASIESIQFYRHPVSGRWWMEVPYQHSIGKKTPKTRLIPCSEKDYEFAKGDDIPERWWLMYNKLV